MAWVLRWEECMMVRFSDRFYQWLELSYGHKSVILHSGPKGLG